tara:strand:+ start:3093 stop:3548 length:456 start_codon:yes stop_codon:yes gene_type:complete
MTPTAGANDQQKMHATAVAISGVGVMIRGKSGSGKSDLALRLIDRGATLIGDDYVEIRRRDGKLLLSPPSSLAGKLEVRSLGILECDHVSDIELKLVIDLKEDPDRFPLDKQVMILLGIAAPFCTLDAMETSAAIKAELALQRIMQDIDGA